MTSVLEAELAGREMISQQIPLDSATRVPADLLQATHDRITHVGQPAFFLPMSARAHHGSVTVVRPRSIDDGGDMNLGWKRAFHTLRKDGDD